MDLRERLQAITDLNETELPDRADINPAYLTDDELKECYLDFLEEGLVSPDAARKLGKTGKWFRKFRTQASASYDPEFALRYEEIMAPDGSNHAALAETALEAMVQAAKDGNMRAAEKILMAYHADFAFMRPAAFSGDVNIENLAIVMKDLPTEILQQAREALLAKQRKELTA